jgi:hypothetical protein
MSDLWHSGAKRVVIPQAPQNLGYTGGGRKPHFTIELRNGKRILHQHLPINRAASALAHPGGTAPTNTANAIQVEIVGFASKSGDWPKKLYHYLHLLAEWCKRHFNVPMIEHVVWQKPQKIDDFVAYDGHCGHVHVPHNDHTDPGRGFHIGYVLNDI